MIDTAVEKRTGAEDVIWDLSIFYSGVDDPAIGDDMERNHAQADRFVTSYKDRVAGLSTEEMRKALQEYEEIQDLMGRIATFAYLTFSEDTNNPQYGALVQCFSEHQAAVDQKLVFFNLEWLQADDGAVQKVLDDPAIGKYRHHLESARRFKPYQLSEVEEKLLLDKAVTGRTAWGRFYDQLIASIRVPYEGEQVTLAEVAAKIEDPDREVRRKASEAIAHGMNEHSMTLTYIFNVLVADKAAEDRRRGYKSWISWRNLDNKVPDEVVDALVKAVTDNYDIVERHYRLKRDLLGIGELFDYDRHAPLPVAEGETEYDWDQAREIVLDAYNAFSPQMADIARRFFEERWIHAPLAPGKDAGAFCTSSVPSAHPFMLMNFAGRAGDVGTLAHELGHGVHGYLAQKEQGILGADAPVTISEMASTFGEMLVFSDLMSKEANPAARLVMLSRELEYTFATVQRQIAFNRFEDRLHNARREEGELSAERITELWLQSIRAMFGDGLTVRDEYGRWWGNVLHFVHIPGYVYGYAFGKLLVLALYKLYQERGESFVPKFVELLAAGGSDYPDVLVAKLGVDLTDPAFWAQGIESIREMVEQEEQLAREVYPEKFS
ncbi:MAG TPA: M3 family oligoendopeptidase [Chloroflexia bacterium]|nr:M3 family oligoendopeptidase [Chloroflexia bacterium]